MKKVCAITLLFAALLCLGSCGEYTSHYKAVAFVHSNEPDSAFMNFYEFEGTMVFKLRNKDAKVLKYTAALESGEAEISYDCGEGKNVLCAVKAGDEFDSETALLPAGTLYIIVETAGKCRNGKFEFNLK